jgi:hypothetical protein
VGYQTAKLESRLTNDESVLCDTIIINSVICHTWSPSGSLTTTLWWLWQGFLGRAILGTKWQELLPVGEHPIELSAILHNQIVPRDSAIMIHTRSWRKIFSSSERQNELSNGLILQYVKCWKARAVIHWTGAKKNILSNPRTYLVETRWKYSFVWVYSRFMYMREHKRKHVDSSRENRDITKCSSLKNISNGCGKWNSK